MSAVAERPLRVLHVVQPTTGGAAVCVRELARAGVRRGLDITVASPDRDELPGWIRDSGARWVEVPLVRSPTPADLRMTLRLRRLLRTADVVHLHSAKAGALGRVALRSMGRSRPGSVFTPHGWSWQVGGRAEWAYRGFERLAAPWADVMVAVSEDARAMGSQVLGPRAANMRLIVNGVDVDRFSPDAEPAERRPEPLVVCVGRLTEAKGQDLLVRALALTETPGLRVRLVGDGEERDAIAALIQELGVADRVEMTGSVDDPERHYRTADVVCVPSRWDGLSLALLEGMASGAPIVATRVNGSGAVKDAGLLVEPGDPAALAAALDRLLADAELRRAFGAEVRRRAVEQFSLEAMVDRTASLWREVAR